MKRFQNAVKMYERKGMLGTLLSATSLVTMVYTVYSLIRYVWPYYLQLEPWPYVYCITQVMFPVAWICLYHVLLVPVYSGWFPSLEKYRVQKNPFPWQKNNDHWYSIELPKLVGVITFNLFVLGFILTFFDMFRNVHKYRKDLESFPPLSEVVWQLVFCALCEDVSFYWIHRLFHKTKLYKYHKLHHEHFNTFSISAFYSHPIDYVVSGILPLIIGWKILGTRMHYASYLVWSAVRSCETLDGHCGYEFPWSPFRVIPFSGSSEYHNYHHSHNDGNFSSLFTFWDSFCGTNDVFYAVRPKKLGDIRTSYKTQ